MRQTDNTWHDTAEAVINNWIGKVYQITHPTAASPSMMGLIPGRWGRYTRASSHPRHSLSLPG